uniref:Ribonuclease H-like domain-containing protein n=1 Tax=Tanacetum cinerariifolium TaxID=118510 RepID=A0A6L2NRN2_TANCI|nr:ribonuclease H-like domain-containing protein [Tanacetum cinerariifolium]
MMKKSLSLKNEPCCSKDCKKNTKTLNKKITELSDKLFDANNMIYHYKLALAQVESRLVEYKEREVKYCEKIRTLKFHNESNNECIEILKKKLETLKEEKEGVDGKLVGLLKASKDLNNLIESQRSDKNKDGLGYSVVPPLLLNSTYLPRRIYPGLVSQNAAERSTTNKVETVKKPSVRYDELYRKPSKKSTVRGNQRNWNNLKSQQLGENFRVQRLERKLKARTPKVDRGRSRKRVTKSFTPKPVAHRPYKPSQRPVKTNMNDTRPNKTSFNKQAHSYENRPFHRTSAVRPPYRAPWVPTVNKNLPPVNRKFSPGSRNFPTANRKFPTASRKFPTGSTKCSAADMGMKRKAATYPTSFDEGCVSFGQGGCKITGKGTIKTGKLEFENDYFVKDLKYNLFSVSQICDNKNSILSTDSECIVLGRDFKLLDDANILLRTPRQHNMYSINLNNIVPHRYLTCLVAKASANECMLRHKRLGHLSFKTMNKLVRHNLVRGLPTRCFENDHTYTACLKGKQHKASLKASGVGRVCYHFRAGGES